MKHPLQAKAPDVRIRTFLRSTLGNPLATLPTVPWPAWRKSKKSIAGQSVHETGSRICEPTAHRTGILQQALCCLSLSLSLCLTLLPFCSRRFPSCLEVVRLPEGHRTRHERHLAVSRVPVQLSSGSSVGGGSRAGASAALACSQTCSEPNQRHLDC